MDLAVAVFAASTLFVVYVLFGYPVVLALWPVRPSSAPDRSVESPKRTVTILLPVRNGERWIRQKLESLLALDYPRDLVRILVISDHSTDRTEQIVESFGSSVELLRSPGHGKSDAINHGILHATGEILFFNDVRQTLDRDALKTLVASFDDPAVGVATGELIIRSGETTEEESVGLYWRYEKWIRQRHSAIDSVLGATGAIYAIRRGLARPLPPFTLLDDVHIPMFAFFAGHRIRWVGQARAYDSPTALDAEFRRKVRTQAGMYQLIAEFPGLLGPRNRMWVHFMSHKVGRLLLPYALVAMLASSPFLPHPWNVVVIAAQAAFYALAVVDPVVREQNPLKRVTALVRTFVVLMAAALWGASILFRSSASFWRSPTKT